MLTHAARRRAVGPRAGYHSAVAYVYILRCRDGSLYTGAAKDLEARVDRHQRGRASRYTRARLPVTLVWWRTLRTWSGALREEHRIKTLHRDAKLALVAAGPRGHRHRATPGTRAPKPSRG